MFMVMSAPAATAIYAEYYMHHSYTQVAFFVLHQHHHPIFGKKNYYEQGKKNKKNKNTLQVIVRFPAAWETAGAQQGPGAEGKEALSGSESSSGPCLYPGCHFFLLFLLFCMATRVSTRDGLWCTSILQAK